MSDRGWLRTVGPWIAAAFLLCALAALRLWSGLQQRDRQRGSGGALPAVLSVVASSQATGAPATLALDGRTRGAGPFAWRAAREDRDPWLELQLPSGLAIDAVWVQTDQASAPVLSVDGVRVAGGTRGALGAWLFSLPAPREARRLRVGGTAELAEVSPWFAGEPVWLLEPDGGDDWSYELLHGYGVPTRRVPLSLFEAARPLLSPQTALVIAPQALSDPQRQLLRATLHEPRRLVELSPVSGLCGRAAEASGVARRLLHASAPDALGADAAPGSAPMRFIGGLATHQPNAGDPMAQIELADDRGQPALVRVAVGAGQCFRWLGDLASALLRLRQGDPALADRDVDQHEGVQPQDLFYASIEPGDFAMPSADRLLELSVARLSPAYRFQLLPASSPSVIVMSVDQDFVPDAGVLAQSQQALAAGLTLLLTDGEIGAKPDVTFPGHASALLSQATAATLRQRGHDLGVHPNLLGLSPAQMRHAITRQVERFAERYGQRPRVVRNHHLQWAGYTDMARWQAHAGLALNLDFVALAIVGKGELGFLNASAYPLRFAEPSAGVLPILQQGTQIDDHVFLPTRFGYRSRDDASLAMALSALLERARGAEPFPVTLNHHPAWWYQTQGRFQARMLASARALGMPVISADAWLDHVLAVRGSLAARDPRSGRLRVVAGGPDIAVLMPDASATPARVLGGLRYRVEAAQPGQSREWELPR